MNEKGEIIKEPNLQTMKEELFAVSIDDIQTKQTIKEAFETYKVLFEPHGAVGWAGLGRFLLDNPEYNTPEQLCVSLETAHPAKFPSEIQEILKFDPQLPVSLLGLEEKEEKFDSLENNYHIFKQFLIDNYN